MGQKNVQGQVLGQSPHGQARPLGSSTLPRTGSRNFMQTGSGSGGETGRVLIVVSETEAQ